MLLGLLLLGVFVYFVFLFFVVCWVGCCVGVEGFYVGDRESFWLVVVFGMIGMLFFGVIFISVLGLVVVSGFSYL